MLNLCSTLTLSRGRAAGSSLAGAVRFASLSVLLGVAMAAPDDL